MPMVCKGGEKQSDLGSVFEAMVVDLIDEIIYTNEKNRESRMINNVVIDMDNGKDGVAIDYDEKDFRKSKFRGKIRTAHFKMSVGP